MRSLAEGLILAGLQIGLYVPECDADEVERRGCELDMLSFEILPFLCLVQVVGIFNYF